MERMLSWTSPRPHPRPHRPRATGRRWPRPGRTLSKGCSAGWSAGSAGCSAGPQREARGLPPDLGGPPLKSPSCPKRRPPGLPPTCPKSCPGSPSAGVLVRYQRQSLVPRQPASLRLPAQIMLCCSRRTGMGSSQWFEARRWNWRGPVCPRLPYRSM
ncbi:hypothetical protein Ctob_010282 [Chrysochromulina tobinii]|uniref:Uncharacterized protein n=1 Tax=Chrysochromulina tobinii TaxID=1460289 RepID=A0A0M0JFE1_9EUKA|nr:hypothetical protein Ctob_010282 [Chrysochromulina tobinii]|eukprot:KOO25165.1 hypothetical protein Ctob_010282 [Chrysochromulina sp. CCMP291]